MSKSSIKNLIHNLFFINNLKLSKFKNKHLGETCYLIGDGAELRFFDLSKFDDHPAICFNFSYLHKDIINRKSVYYSCLVEPFFVLKNSVPFAKTEIIKNLINYVKRHSKDLKLNFFISSTNIFNFMGKNTLKIFYRLPQDSFTKEWLKYSYKFNQGSFSNALTLARYMGFSDIFLIGISEHFKSYWSYWYKFETKKNWDNYLEYKGSYDSKDYEYLAFISEMKNHFNSINIITAEESSSLMFETIDYKRYTGLETKLKSPFELANSKFINLVNKFKSMDGQDYT
jgi:hypothetical protein